MKFVGENLGENEVKRTGKAKTRYRLVELLDVLSAGAIWTSIFWPTPGMGGGGGGTFDNPVLPPGRMALISACAAPLCGWRGGKWRVSEKVCAYKNNSYTKQQTQKPNQYTNQPTNKQAKQTKQTSKQTNKQTKQTSKQTNKHTHKQRNKQTNKTDKQTKNTKKTQKTQTNKQANKHTSKQTRKQKRHYVLLLLKKPTQTSPEERSKRMPKIRTHSHPPARPPNFCRARRKKGRGNG